MYMPLTLLKVTNISTMTTMPSLISMGADCVKTSSGARN